MSDTDGRSGVGAALDAAFFGYDALALGLVLGHDSGLLDGFLAGPTTAVEFGNRVGTDERLTLEWLRVMVVAGFADHIEGTFQPLPGLAEAMNPRGLGSRAELISMHAHGTSRILTLLAEAVGTRGGFRTPLMSPSQAGARTCSIPPPPPATSFPAY